MARSRSLSLRLEGYRKGANIPPELFLSPAEAKTERTVWVRSPPLGRLAGLHMPYAHMLGLICICICIQRGGFVPSGLYARVLYRLDELEGLVVHVFVVVPLDIRALACFL